MEAVLLKLKTKKQKQTNKNKNRFISDINLRRNKCYQGFSGFTGK